MFWILAIGLLVAAALFVAVPLLRAPAGDRSGRAAAADQTVRALYQDRLAELEAEAAAGRLDPEVREQVMQELGANLLDDYRELEVASAVDRETVREAAGGAGRLAWVLALLLPLGGVGVYWLVGEPTASAVAGASVVLQLDPDADRAEIEAWQSRLARRVGSRPDDAQSWYLLGSTRLQLGDFSPAAEAFARAHAITGPDPVIDLYWLQARYLAQGGTLDADTREIAERVLARRDSHPLVLEMYAIDAFRRGEYQASVTYLNRALNNDLGQAQLLALLGGLERARAEMGALQPSVEVAVSAAAGAPRDALLFVIARPPGGGIPYAVVRRPAGLLPLSVHLDDTVSMNPDLPLSSAPVIEVVVRLSRSGSPAAQPGDWEWRSDPLVAADLAVPLTLSAILLAPDPLAPDPQAPDRSAGAAIGGPSDAAAAVQGQAAPGT